MDCQRFLLGNENEKENKFFAHLPLAEESKKAIVQPYSNLTNFPQPYKGPRKRKNINNWSSFFSKRGQRER